MDIMTNKEIRKEARSILDNYGFFKILGTSALLYFITFLIILVPMLIFIASAGLSAMNDPDIREGIVSQVEADFDTTGDIGIIGGADGPTAVYTNEYLPDATGDSMYTDVGVLPDYVDDDDTDAELKNIMKNMGPAGWCMASVLYIIAIALSSIFGVGYLSYIVNIVRDDNPKFTDIFSGFRHAFRNLLLPLATAIAMLPWVVMVILGIIFSVMQATTGNSTLAILGLVLLIAGMVMCVIASYKYMLTYYVAADSLNGNPSAFECVKVSANLSKGYKFRIFCMLTFFGVAGNVVNYVGNILSALVGGSGIIIGVILVYILIAGATVYITAWNLISMALMYVQLSDNYFERVSDTAGGVLNPYSENAVNNILAMQAMGEVATNAPKSYSELTGDTTKVESFYTQPKPEAGAKPEAPKPEAGAKPEAPKPEAEAKTETHKPKASSTDLYDGTVANARNLTGFINYDEELERLRKAAGRPTNDIDRILKEKGSEKQSVEESNTPKSYSELTGDNTKYTSFDSFRKKEEERKADKPKEENKQQQTFEGGLNSPNPYRSFGNNGEGQQQGFGQQQGLNGQGFGQQQGLNGGFGGQGFGQQQGLNGQGFGQQQGLNGQGFGQRTLNGGQGFSLSKTLGDSSANQNKTENTHNDSPYHAKEDSSKDNPYRAKTESTDKDNPYSTKAEKKDNDSQYSSFYTPSEDKKDE